MMQCSKQGRLRQQVRFLRRQFLQEGDLPFTDVLSEEIVSQALADLYRQRWHTELDLRSIKTTMQMDQLRCKTPELVHKEVWTHILAYNLIRTIMAQAAIRHEIEPRTISFKGAVQTLEAFQPLIDFQGRRGRAFRLATCRRW